MNHHNLGTNKDKLVDFNAWANSLRLPLTGRRKGIVDCAWGALSGGDDSTTVGKAKAAFGYEHFDKWCEMFGCGTDENASISRNDFTDFYADVSICCFDDKNFLNLVEKSWGITESAPLKVHHKDLERLVAALRQNLLKMSNPRHNEEFCLRQVFRKFDRNNNGSVSAGELKCILEMIDLTADDHVLQALIDKCDINGNGCLEFEEFVHLVLGNRYHKQ